MEIQILPFVVTLLELLAAIFALVHYDKYKGSKEGIFLYFLWYTFLLDVTGAVLGYGFEQNNIWLYNAYTITSFSFYFYWYSTILERKGPKIAIPIFVAVFVIVAVASLFVQKWLEYHSYTFATGALFVLVLTVIHFYQLLRSDEVLNIKHKLSFWISTGLLLFYMGMIPLMLLSKYLGFGGGSYYIILVSLNAILYGCYIIGFVWTKKKYNRF